VELLEKHGEDARDLALALSGLARVELALDLDEVALKHAESARTQRANAVASRPEDAALTAFVLSRALWKLDRDRDRARNLTHEAREKLAEAHVGDQQLLPELERWLDIIGREGSPRRIR
jgi:hypothetical protein